MDIAMRLLCAFVAQLMLVCSVSGIKIALQDPRGEGVGRGTFSSYLEVNHDVPIICIVPNEFVCGENSTFDIYNEETSDILRLEPCVLSHSHDKHGHNKACYQEISIPRQNSTIVQIMLSGRLRCRYNDGKGKVETSTNFLRLPFLPCTLTYNSWCHGLDTDSQCPRNEKKAPQYCIVTKSGTDKCAKLKTMDLCENEYSFKRFCPVNEMGLCLAIVRNYSAVWFEIPSTHQCPDTSDAIATPLKINGQTLLHDEPILILGDTNISVEFDCDSPGFTNQSYYVYDPHDLEIVPYSERAGACVGKIRIGLSRLTENVEQIINSPGAFTEFFEMDVGEARFEHQIVVFDKEGIIPSISGLLAYFADTSLNLSIDTGRLTCRFLPFVDGRAFNVLTWWTKESAGSSRLDEKDLSGVEMNESSTWGLHKSAMSAYREDTYQCHARLMYKRCLPFRELGEDYHSNAVQYRYNRGVQVRGDVWVFLLTLIWKHISA